MIEPGSVASTNGPGNSYRITAAKQAEHQSWEGRSDAITRVSDYIATLIGARAGAAVIPLRG